ncbi:SusC/RagA family TonB-linked outer membrane protein [Arenibacter sp. GZD96]|uniref:SusC/RagA family TonB-linked outer membrane protein n=1 Tax=Aurantibrevibacter litoralis TaxID=3106030 RepID=UPI002AFF414E|nr:SusC/RagA family TonB-linked outer membrane protein [Arenibacter sp. GZD-96]MEA1785547.1 SusC/RagA family TonB-linked outer membrane protein [Arenibacter sp. GZD-96]
MKITLLKSFLLFGAFLSFGLAKAQDVSGTVSDASGPLPGASIVVKGTTNGAQTDFDGNYSLSNVPNNATLVFSYIGFKSVEIAVNGRSTINVTLEEDAQALDEVIIIGYGTTTFKSTTGSVSSVTSENFNAGVIASPEELIQGKTAGVQITQNSGEPGAGVNIRIRGSNSVRSNNNPLFVVDGVPLGGGSAPGAGNTGFGDSETRNPLNFLNPADIESMSILKDASATAIYGSRGANGVVIITTKSGKGSAGGVFEFSSSLSISEPAEEFDLLNRNQFLAAVGQFGGDPSAQDFGNNTDWQDVVTRTVASQNQNLSYSNNYGKGNVRATLGYGKQFGIIENSSLERLTGRINATHRFLEDKLTINLQTTISRVNDEAAPLSGTAGFRGDLLGAAYSANPTWPNNPGFDTGGQLNPATVLAFTQNLTNTDRYLLNGSADYKFTPELSAKVNVGFDKSKAWTNSASSSLARNLDRGVFGNGRAVFNNLNVENRLLEATVNYTKTFGNSNLDVLVGYSFQDFQRWGRNAEGFGFNTTDMNQMSTDLAQSANAAQNSIDGSFQQFGYDARSNQMFVNRLFPAVVTDFVTVPVDSRVRSLVADTFDVTDEIQSFFGRVNYTLADKYIFSATIRADGSSRFGPDEQYGYFPSASFAWQLAEEDFIGDAFSTLKLRVGAGLVGNQEGLGFGEFVRRTRFAGVGIADGGDANPSGTVAVATANPDLKWEETLDLNLGIDFGFNNDRFNGSLDFYRKETEDLLLRTPAPAPSTDPFFFRNLSDGTVVNQGVELALNYDWIRTADVTFSTSFNIAYNDNEVKDFDGFIDTGAIRGQGLSNAFAQRLTGGRSLFSYYMAVFEGLDANGQPTFKDVDGNGSIDTSLDKEFVDKDALPNVTTGLSLNLSVKNWDFSTFFTGQFGFYVYNNTANAFFTSGAISNARNVIPSVVNSGEAPGTAADVSTRYLEKGDFVRLQNASVSYNVPVSGEGLFKSFRISATGQNLFLITDYTGLDPEVTTNTGDLGSGIPSAGIDLTAFPKPRTVTIGINATF